MTKSSSAPRRQKTPSPGTVTINSKRRGELAELRFTLKAAIQGFAVSKPYGDSERYDFILDSRDEIHRVTHVRTAALGCPTVQKDPSTLPSPNPTLHRIQVKCSTQLLNGLYRVNAHRRTNGRAVPYLPSEIDFLIAYIIPEDTWYVIPIQAVRATSLLFRRKKDRRPGLYDQYREAWHLLRAP